MNNIKEHALSILGIFALMFLGIMGIVNQKNKHFPESAQKFEKSFYSLPKQITVTTYFAVKEQCDISPFITADGSEIDSTTKDWCAVSQDLLVFLDYGDTIYVEVGIKEYDGYYVIHDCMNSRVKNCVDILIPPGDKRRGGLWKGKVKWNITK